MYVAELLEHDLMAMTTVSAQIVTHDWSWKTMRKTITSWSQWSETILNIEQPAFWMWSIGLMLSEDVVPLRLFSHDDNSSLIGSGEESPPPYPPSSAPLMVLR